MTPGVPISKRGEEVPLYGAIRAQKKGSESGAVMGDRGALADRRCPGVRVSSSTRMYLAGHFPLWSTCNLFPRMFLRTEEEYNVRVTGGQRHH